MAHFQTGGWTHTAEMMGKYGSMIPCFIGSIIANYGHLPPLRSEVELEVVVSRTRVDYTR